MALLIGTVVLVLVAISLAGMPRGPQFTPVSANPSITIETKDLRSGNVRFFKYRDRAGDQIRFILARDSTGRVRAAFDACQSCYIHHKGYVNFPVKLPFQRTGKTVTIRPADLERERGLF
jgi:uncharacterized membrane protein